MSIITRSSDFHTPLFNPRIEEESDRSALHASLNAWCEEMQGTPEYYSRLEAAEKIEYCFIVKSPELSLIGLYLTSIPKEIGSIRSLRSIDLENNRLTSLPFEIYNLNLLKFLNLRENHLEFLPEGIHNLENLKELVLDDNPLRDLPMDLIQMHDCLISLIRCDHLPEGFLEHYSQNRSQNLRNFVPPIR